MPREGTRAVFFSCCHCLPRLPSQSKTQPGFNQLIFIFGCSPRPKIDLRICSVSCYPTDEVFAA